jgi:hypothetical protein
MGPLRPSSQGRQPVRLTKIYEVVIRKRDELSFAQHVVGASMGHYSAEIQALLYDAVDMNCYKLGITFVCPPEYGSSTRLERRPCHK